MPFNSFTHLFDRIKFPGWFGNFGNADKSLFDAYYDDIYVATGANAFARVEISDAVNFTDSIVNLTMPIVSWAQDKIVIKVHQENAGNFSTWFLRVHDKNDNLVAKKIL